MVMCPLFITTVSDNLFNVKKKTHFNRTSYIILKVFNLYVSKYIICICAYDI